MSDTPPTLSLPRKGGGDAKASQWVAPSRRAALGRLARRHRRYGRPSPSTGQGNRMWARCVWRPSRRALRALLILRQAQDEVPYLQQTTILMLSFLIPSLSRDEHEEPPPFDRLRVRAASRTMAIEHRYMQLPCSTAGSGGPWCQWRRVSRRNARGGGDSRASGIGD